jgi:hypothetical protein
MSDSSEPSKREGFAEPSTWSSSVLVLLGKKEVSREILAPSMH